MPSQWVRNVTDGPKVLNACAPIILNPGEAQVVEIIEAELESALLSGWFEPVSDPLDHDGNGKKGCVRKVKPAE